MQITEQPSLYDHLEKKSVREILEDINREDQKVASAVQDAVQDAADEFGLGEVEFFAGVCDPQFFFCGHPDFDDVCLSFSRRVIAVLLCVCVRTFHFSHIRPPVKMINARSGMERAM